MALIGALQPLFTALITVVVLHKRLSGSTWIGLALGFGGVALVLWPRLAAADASALSLPVALIAAGSILSLTVGSMVQKSPLAASDLRSAGAVQNLGAVMVLIIMALIGGFMYMLSACGGAEAFGRAEQRGDVLEAHALLREVGDVADQ